MYKTVFNGHYKYRMAEVLSHDHVSMVTQGFPFRYLSGSFSICLTPYNRKTNVLSVSLNKTYF